MRISSLIVIGLLTVLGLGGAADKARAGLFIGISVAPPALPVYTQPPCPGPGYIWTPGYWAWNADISDYYWVPGAWAVAPTVGLLWTPGYWGWSNGAYVWNAGYWGPHVGFYGGVSYGFGYTGAGFAGGYWSGGSFFYNRAVTNVGNTTVVSNVYNQTVINNNTTNVSYNGGNGGVQAQPTSQELQAANEHHIAPTQDQQNHQQLASQNKDLRASVNGGKPAIAAVTKPGDFSPHNVVAAKAAGGPVKPASLTSSDSLNAHPGGNNQAGNAPSGKTHTNANVAAKPNGAAGANHLDAAHGANKNAVANLNPESGDKHKGMGPAANHTNGMPPKAAALSGAGPNGAGPMAHAQPHPNMAKPGNMPKPAAHAQPHPPAPKPAAHAQPHPAAQPKKDQHHG